MASSYSFIFVAIVYISVLTLAWIALLCWTAWHSCRNATKVRTTSVLTEKQI
jgi:threonine/homoserine/homoserine lactone efflux protein